MRLTEKVAVVTGASRGLGKTVALRYAREGAKVVICSRQALAAESVAKEMRRLGSEVLALKADVSSERDVDRLVDSALKKFKRIDILVNNASVLTQRAPIHKVRVPDWGTTISINLTGAFLCIRKVLPEMLSSKKGSIINVSSGAGKRQAPFWGPYAVSKFGIEGLTMLTAAEIRDSGVRINSVNPGGIRTQMRAFAYPEEDPKTLPMPGEIAGLFVYLACDSSSHINGESIEAMQWIKENPEWL